MPVGAAVREEVSEVQEVVDDVVVVVEIDDLAAGVQEEASAVEAVFRGVAE